MGWSIRLRSGNIVHPKQKEKQWGSQIYMQSGIVRYFSRPWNSCLFVICATERAATKEYNSVWFALLFDKLLHIQKKLTRLFMFLHRQDFSSESSIISKNKRIYINRKVSFLCLYTVIPRIKFTQKRIKFCFTKGSAWIVRFCNNYIYHGQLSIKLPLCITPKLVRDKWKWVLLYLAFLKFFPATTSSSTTSRCSLKNHVFMKEKYVSKDIIP